MMLLAELPPVHTHQHIEKGGEGREEGRTEGQQVERGLMPVQAVVALGVTQPAAPKGRQTRRVLRLEQPGVVPHAPAPIGLPQHGVVRSQARVLPCAVGDDDGLRVLHGRVHHELDVAAGPGEEALVEEQLPARAHVDRGGRVGERGDPCGGGSGSWRGGGLRRRASRTEVLQRGGEDHPAPARGAVGGHLAGR